MRHNRKLLAVSNPYIRGMGQPCKERRTPVTVEEFRVSVIKDRLTLWFYCVKEGCSEARIRWRAAQIKGFCWGLRCCVPRHCRAPIPRV